MYITYWKRTHITQDLDKAEPMLRQDIEDQMRKNGEDPAAYEFELTVEKERVKLAARRKTHDAR